MKVSIFNPDGTKAVCPHGASVQFPIGTIQRVHVADSICTSCPCYQKTRYDLVMPYVECEYINNKK